MGSSAITADERVLDVAFSDDALSVSLRDGRVISVPLVWYPRLLNATPAQRKNWKIVGGGYGIHWPDVDEDLSTEGMLRGAKAPRGALTQVEDEIHPAQPRTPLPTASPIILSKYGHEFVVWEKAKAEAVREISSRARRESTITYSDLTQKISSIAFGPSDYSFHYLLYEISREEDAAGRGLLSALVVRKEDGLPGQGFFDLARETGRDVADPMLAWTEEVKLVFAKWQQN
jgi:Protein of unknown function (DUF2442)